MDDETRRSAIERGSIEAFVDHPSISEGQRGRLRLFQAVESGICSRVEQLCVSSGIEVTDVAVLVVAPAAHGLFFTGDATPGTSVVLGHRAKIHEFLESVLPPADDAPFDPYSDLLDQAPDRCVRVLIVDDESLTVMSYGTFVTVRLTGSEMPSA